MRIDLDAKVRTRDGEEAGTLQYAIIDPDTNEVTHFVVSTGFLFGRDVQLPRSELERASRDGDVVVLEMSKAELEGLPTHAPAQYVAPPAGWELTAGMAFPPGAYLWPATVMAAAPPSPPPSQVASPTETVSPGDAAHGAAPGATADQIGIGKGAAVVDANGDDIGVVEELFYEEQTGTLRGFTLRVGGALRTLFGGGECVSLAAHQVERIGESTIYLNVTRDQLPALAAGAALTPNEG